MRVGAVPVRSGVACALTVVGLTAAGCGGGGERSTTPPNAGPRGATVAVPELPTTLDPAKATSLAERAIAVATQTPLLTYRRATGDDAATLEPALAGDLPTLSTDDREYRFQLRRGLVYADGRLVKASDVERAIAHASVDATDPTVRTTLGSIIGAPSRDGQTLSGVRSDDRTGIVEVRLRHADGRIPFALADPATAPLPELPKGDAAPASTGPLRIASRTAASIQLAANPLRATISTVPAAKLSQVSIVPGGSPLAAHGVHAADLRAGKVDLEMAVGPSDGIANGITRVSGATTSVVSAYLPQAGETASRATRKAIAGSVDARGATSKLGEWAPTCSLVPSFAVGSVERDPCPAPPTDAKKTLLEGRRFRVAVPPTPWAEAAKVLVFQAITRLGGDVTTVTAAEPVDEVERGDADIAITRSGPRLPHPSLWLDDAASFDALLAREVPRLTRGPLTGTGGQWSALEKRAVDRAVAIPLLALERPVVIGPQVDRRSVLIHPVLGLDLAALDLA